MTPAAFRRLALSFPEATEAPHFERASFRVKNKIFATMKESAKEAMVRVPAPEGVEALLEAHPQAFFSYGETWTMKNGSLGVHLARVDDTLLKELLTESWRRTAPKKLVDAFDARRG